jgi:hypothetical protein
VAVNRKRNSSPDIHPVLGFWRGLVYVVCRRFLVRRLTEAGPLAVFIMLWGTLFAQARTQPEMLFVTKENCALIRGYSKHDIAGVSREFNIPVSKIRYVRAEWGRGQEGFEQCNLVFSTPQGNKSCKVFNIMKDEFVFAFAVPIPGNHAICN